MSYFKHDQALVHPQAQIGENTRIWAFTNIQEGAVIGQGCNICDGSFVEKGAVVGNHCTIKHHVSIFDGVVLENDVFVGSNTGFINDRNPRSNRDDEWTLEKTLVKKGVTIGSNVTIMCGIEIGEYAVIGAGSVVTKNVAPYTIVYGNPAEFGGFACICGKKLNQNYQCPCGKNYKLNEGRLCQL